MPTNHINMPPGLPGTSGDAPSQLDLFVITEPARSTPEGLTPEAARAAISPGWWQIVSACFHRDSGLIVTECREVAGSLELATTRVSGSDAGSSRSSWAREVARSTCGCCGGGGAQPYCDFGQPVRVVCSSCRENLLAGETYMGLADRYYTLEGKRRIPPLPVPSTSAGSRGTATTRSRLRPCTTLPPDELRELVRSVRASMQATICGEEDAVAALRVPNKTWLMGSAARSVMHGARATDSGVGSDVGAGIGQRRALGGD
jgi:hypothetical protein